MKVSRGAHFSDGHPTVQPPSNARAPLGHPSYGLSDNCPHCGGELRMIPGTPAYFKARCTECGDVWRQGDSLRWERDRIPLRYKIMLASLPVLSWIAGHAEVAG